MTILAQKKFSDKATISLMGFFLSRVDGELPNKVPAIKEADKKGDLCDYYKPSHVQAMNIYKCKDGRWYQLHESFDSRPILKALGLPDPDMTLDEAVKMYADRIIDIDSGELDSLMNDQLKTAGVICYDSKEEFYSLPHVRIPRKSIISHTVKSNCDKGQAMAKEPMGVITPIAAPRKPWPKVTEDGSYKPLAGIRVIDWARAVAAPSISRILASLGADVVRVSYDGVTDLALSLVDLSAGKRDVCINLRTDEGKAQFRELVKDADVLVDGHRPNALAKHGFYSSSLREINPSLIYVRECCYGWSGEWSHRPGWQHIADAVSGLTWLEGKFFGLDEPVMPILRKFYLPFVARSAHPAFHRKMPC
jgi:hypothetical protein